MKKLISRDQGRIEQAIINMERTAQKATNTLKAVLAAYPTEKPTIELLISFNRDRLKFVADRVKGYPASFDLQKAIHLGTIILADEQKALLNMPVQYLVDDSTYKVDGLEVVIRKEAIDRITDLWSRYAETPEQIERLEFFETVRAYAEKNGFSIPQLLKHAFLHSNGQNVRIESTPKVEWVLHGRVQNPPARVIEYK